MSTHDAHGHDDHSSNEAEGITQNNSFGWIIYVVIAVVILFFVISKIQSTKQESNANNQNSEATSGSNSSSGSQVVRAVRYEPILVTLTSNWQKISVPYGVKAIRYKNATVKYCIKNSIEEKESKDIEDISGKFINKRTENSLIIFYKNQGEEGKLTIELEYD